MASFFDSAAECPGMEAEDTSGASRPADDPVGLSEDGNDVMSFHNFACRRAAPSVPAGARSARNLTGNLPGRDRFWPVSSSTVSRGLTERI
jgi:hypothetical protein